MKKACVAALLLGALTAFPAEESVIKLGQISVNKAEKLITFPGTVNMTNGLLEYAIVHSAGKVHESVLATEVRPREIHAAMLLLGVSATNVVADNAPSGQIDVPANIEPKGDPVEISVSWETPNGVVQKPVAELIFNTKSKNALSKHPWVYNGSRMNQGAFLADLSGSIVSLITDLDALINNASKGHTDDTIWQVHTNVVPALKSPVQVTFRLRQPGAASAPPGELVRP